MIKAEYVEIADAIDNNDWDEQSTIQTGKFSISQFQGTAFDSDYECYQVRWSEWAYGDNVLLAKRIPYSLVVKKTEPTEENILKMLKQKGFPVPNIGPVLRYNNGRIMIFMEMLPGKELFSCTDDNSWINAISSLALIHSEFWGVNSNIKTKIPFSNTTEAKIRRAYSNTSHNKYWKPYMDAVIKRFENAPQTLIHGDMFPTNILVYQGSCNFVDWANAGISPYMMDIGRLTSIINKDTLLPMCPCSEKVIHAYYEKMRPLLEIEYDAYLKDVYMSQFLELAYFYSPLVFGRPKDKYSLKIEQRLHEIVECHFK